MTTRFTGRPHRALAAALSLLLAACGGSEPSQPASIAIATTAAGATVNAGATTTVPVTITRTNFDGVVTLSALGLPAGVTASFSPATLAGASTSSTLTLTAATGATVGTANVVVLAAGAGVSDVSSALALTVQPQPAFGYSTSTSGLTLTPGTSATVNLSVLRTNFTGAVTFTLGGLPAGASASFNPNPVAGDASILTVNTGTAARGTYPLTLTASSAGMPDRNSIINLAVVQPNITLELASTSANATQGSSTTVNATITRTDYTAIATLSASGVPSGATVSFSNGGQISGSSATITLAAGTAAPGTYDVTITLTAPNLPNRTAVIAFTVNAAPNYTLGQSPAPISVTAGASGTTTIDILRAGAFISDVTLTATGLPAGATASFSPNPVFGSSSVLTVASGSAAPGSYTVTVTGTTAGGMTRTTNVSLSIQ